MAEFFPHGGRKAHHRRQETLQLRSAFGVVRLSVWRGKNPADGRWGCPMRQRWGLSPHQQLSPALEDKLAYFATVTGSYAAAAQLAAKVGCAVEDATIHALVQRLGARAEAQTQRRLVQAPPEKTAARAASELAVLMIDGFQVRHRGEGWGQRQSGKPRVAWHETKVGVFYRQEQAAKSWRGRGQLSEKVVLSWQGAALELGQRLHWEAQARGLGRARATLVVGDGAPWIWSLAADRWPGAHQLLDFYHAAQHLWSVGVALHGEGTPATAAWVDRQCHRLRHGQERVVLKELAALPTAADEASEVVRREQNYFATQALRLAYAAAEKRGWPLGSGAVESACRQRQCRRKRPGQFWTKDGLRHLDALEQARDNGHWDELWLTA